MIAAPISEADYRIAGSLAAFMDAGEYGPLPCGCCLVACVMDPVGPRLIYLMMRRDAPESHAHETLADFESVIAGSYAKLPA